MMGVLLDTSILVAYQHRRDKYHLQASQLLPALLDDALIAEPVLQELFYVLHHHAGYRAAVEAIDTMSSIFPIVPLEAPDFRRMALIMRQYADADFDYADVALMALSERLGLQQVATFDRRDFQIFRQSSGRPLELLP